jgi:hypothetical protein
MERRMQSSMAPPKIKKLKAWKYLFLSINTYAFFIAAVLSFGCEKSLPKKSAIAWCYLESSLWFLKRVASSVRFPTNKYQNKQCMGSLFCLYSFAAISSIHFLSCSLPSYHKGIEYYFNHYQLIFWGFNSTTASSLFKEWDRKAIDILVNPFVWNEPLFAMTNKLWE